MDTNKFYCGGTVCITVEGDVTPCSVIRQGFGNVTREPFGEIVERHRRELLFLPLREPDSSSGCSSCKNQAVCWGCRATAYYMTGDFMAEDSQLQGTGKNMTMSIDISVGDVSDAYSGAVGTLWEMVMGEEIHIGGPRATTELATMAGIDNDSRVLDICSALGGPARQTCQGFQVQGHRDRCHAGDGRGGNPADIGCRVGREGHVPARKCPRPAIQGVVLRCRLGTGRLVLCHR